MARTTTVVVALLVAIGLVVAMLPAQESSSRRTSNFKAPPAEMPPTTQPAPGEPGLVPLPIDPTMTPAPPMQPPPGPGEPSSVLARKPATGSLSEQLRASGGAASQDYSGLGPNEGAPAFAPAPDYPSPYQPTEGATPSSAPAAPLAPRSASDFRPAPPAASIAAEAPTEAAPAQGSELRSILKRPQPATVESLSPTITTPVTPAAPASPVVAPAAVPAAAPSDSSYQSSRRTIPTVTNTPLSSKRTPAGITDVDIRSIQDLALTGRSPALRVDVAGPQGITVGKAGSYVVHLVNEGDVPAQDVQLRIALPGHVTSAGSQASSGEAMMHADASGQPRLLWSVPAVPARSHETLRLQLVASEGGAFDLAVDWACRPTMAKATITIKQAQLQLSLSGPAAMTFGEEKVFTLTVSNPGNGDAENVAINLSAGQGRAQQIDVGTIPAGQRKDVSVQIVASQSGEMELRAIATSDGGLSAEGTGKVIVRKAELAVAVEGPQLKYAGTDGAYLVTVQNTGTAPAENVLVSLALPTGAKYLGGINGAPPAGGALKWKLTSLPPGTEKSYEVQLQLHVAGVNRIIVQAQGSAGLVASGEAQTEVEAAPDLKLVVNDPAGPLPTTEHAVYELQVMNRGSQAAEQVKIVVEFSEGIEPIAFDGCEARIVPGQVVCQPLPQLAAGEQVTLRIKAKSGKSGTHQFRVEVTTSDADTRLVSEGTTRFFSEVGRAATPAASTARQPSAFVPDSGTLQR